MTNEATSQAQLLDQDNHQLRGKTVVELLSQTAVCGPVLQELCPISESIPWLHSHQFWLNAGLEIFTSGQVPFVVTNDGEQSRKAVEIYVESLRLADARGEREAVSYVMELGIGTGLFAKLFLDQLREWSDREGTDYYQRTIYIATDGSPNLLNDSRDSGVFANHEDRLIRLNVQASDLLEVLSEPLPNGDRIAGAIRAVHANYVLDSLPFTILSQVEGNLFELQIRTHLRTDAQDNIAHLFPIDGNVDLDSVLTALETHNEVSLRDLLIYESEYVPISKQDLCHAQTIAGNVEGASQQLVNSYGALACIEDVLELLRPDGYMVAMDYGYTDETAPSQEVVEFQCFGNSVAAGVNFAQITRCLKERPDVVVGAPTNDPVSLQARLLGRKQSAGVIGKFEEIYSKESWENQEKPYLEAIELVNQGRFEAARAKFEAAHRLQPYNWTVLEAIAGFFTYNVEDFAAGMEVAKQGLQLNHLSTRFWNILGDCYYGQGDMASAEEVYSHTIKINPDEVRGRTNLAYVFIQKNQITEALHIIAEALTLDRTAEHRDELLGKQSEALDALSGSHLRSLMRAGNGLIGQYKLPDIARDSSL